MSARVLILGYGNPLRGDDGLGWIAAHRLSRLIPDDAVEILGLHQLTPELAEPISTAELVIFIDAAHDAKPGRWQASPVSAASASSSVFSHQLTPDGLLNYAQAIYRTRPRALTISVSGGSFECGEQLSPGVETALEEAIQYIGKQVTEFLRNPKQIHA
jgi:hydrogenase maturation protease